MMLWSVFSSENILKPELLFIIHTYFVPKFSYQLMYTVVLSSTSLQGHVLINASRTAAEDFQK
jgi:hypothetical protein